MAHAPAASRNPWTWVPSLYFAQGIPFVVVMTVSVMMYKRLGVSNTNIAIYTSWLYLPWVIKPLWSPLVDMFGTKRLWVVGFQFLITLSLASLILTIPMDAFLKYTLIAFSIMAISSATHDIAADGYYMLALPEHQQAAFAGVRNTFWRVASITSSGLLVMFAGLIEQSSGLPPAKLSVIADPGVQAVSREAPRSAEDVAGLQVVTDPAVLTIPVAQRSKSEAKELIEQIKRENQESGFYPTEEGAATPGKPATQGWWQRNVSTPSAQFLKKHFGEKEQQAVTRAGNFEVVSFRLSGAPEPGQHVVVTVGHTAGDPTVILAEGTRFVFDASNWNKPAKAVIQLDPNLATRAQATFTAASGNIPLAWSLTFVVFAAMFGALSVYHKLILPVPAADVPSSSARTVGQAGKAFVLTFAEFFRKKDIAKIIAFLLLYRFAEAQLVKLVAPFLLDPREIGGLGLTTSQLGFAYGTVGVICLLCGGLLGGYVVSRRGLKFWLWPMVFIMHLPDATFVWLSQAQPQNYLLINLAVAIEQFGYGFGFTGYMLFMIMVSQGEHKTSHYAICTGFMALSMMLPGMFSGWLQEIIGYQHFFIWVMVATLPGFLVAALVKIDPEFGRKRDPEKVPQPLTTAAAAGLRDASQSDE